MGRLCSSMETSSCSPSAACEIVFTQTGMILPLLALVGHQPSMSPVSDSPIEQPLGFLNGQEITVSAGPINLAILSVTPTGTVRHVDEILAEKNFMLVIVRGSTNALPDGLSQHEIQPTRRIMKWAVPVGHQRLCVGCYSSVKVGSVQDRPRADRGEQDGYRGRKNRLESAAGGRKTPACANTTLYRPSEISSSSTIAKKAMASEGQSTDSRWKKPWLF